MVSGVSRPVAILNELISVPVFSCSSSMEESTGENAIMTEILFSWINPDPFNPLVRFVYQITEPFLAPLRRFIPTFGGLDITPVVALFILDLLRRFLLTRIF